MTEFARVALAALFSALFVVFLFLAYCWSAGL